MMNDAKESYMGHLSCKIHTARTERDLYRVCPSKLSKRELEDLYFALLDQNVQLKKNNNEQRDQIKVLNTRLQRITVHKPAVGFHNKDCCASSKAIINEQKGTIADLKKANDRLSERLRLLNMRLCSAKQFLRRGSSQGAPRCSKFLMSSASIKNSFVSELNPKESDAKLRIDSSSSQIEKDNISTQLAQIEVPTQMAEVTSSQAEIPVQDAPCQRNECRTEIDELKLKISALEEEVCGVRREHSGRMRALEAEASSARTVSAQCGSRASHLSEDLQRSRQRTDELATQLQQQRAFMSELSARRADDLLTGQIERAAADITNRTLPLSEASAESPTGPVPVPSDWEDCRPILVPNNSGISIYVEDKCKNSEDSGVTECGKQDSGEEKKKSLEKRDDLIETQIANLQSQIDNLKMNVMEPPVAALVVESSLSHDIFSNARFKTFAEFDKVPSTSREPDVLVSAELIDVDPAMALEKTQKYEPDYKYNIPGPLSLDLPKICLGDPGDNIQFVKTEARNNNSEDTNNNKECVKINSDKIIDSFDKTNPLIRGMVEEGNTTESFKNIRRSSLKSSSEGKQNRDLAVRYGETQTFMSSARPEPTAKNISQGTDIDKVFVEPDNDHDSDPSVQYKVNERASIRRIRYMNDVQTDPYSAPQLNSSGVVPTLKDAQTDGTRRVSNGVGIQCIEHLAAHSSCDTGQVSYDHNDDVIKYTSANIDTDDPAPQPPSASPDRTDCEMSSLSDLTHTLGTSPRDYMSPGEVKATSTLSQSCVTTDYGSLSEGEVPPPGGQRLSRTEDKITEKSWDSRADKMEEALRSIGEELTRCRELLQEKGGEPASRLSPWSSLSTSDRRPPDLALRRAEASCRMRDSYSPKCIFTLHIGTMVLADHAAAAGRGRPLLAWWSFYQQPGGATRALQGRVINYDCTSHYDLNVTEHFLYYLKHEEMPIIISEIDKQEEAFASCSLPLRDALLHPNRRVDMSLALVPGGCGGDEAGVMDVWCSLRVDATVLPAINTAIVRPSSLKSRHHSSSILDQILEDDHSSHHRYSREVHPRSSKAAVSNCSEDNQSEHSESLDKLPELRSYNEVIENEVPVNIRSVKDFKHAVAKKSNDSTSIYEMLKTKKWSRRSTLGSQKSLEGGRQKSVTISNQTPDSNVDTRKISQTTSEISEEDNFQSLDITIVWLALGEQCRAMSDPLVKRLYIAYNFLGRSGADLETPISIPKPKHYGDKCHFLFKKTFLVNECDMSSLGRLSRCLPAAGPPDPNRAVVFTIISEPGDDPLGLNSCEDIGYASLYLGEVLSRSTGGSYTAVLEVKDERGVICGMLAVRLDGLGLLRRCRERTEAPVSKEGGWRNHFAWGL